MGTLVSACCLGSVGFGGHLTKLQGHIHRDLIWRKSSNIMVGILADSPIRLDDQVSRNTTSPQLSSAISAPARRRAIEYSGRANRRQLCSEPYEMPRLGTQVDIQKLQRRMADMTKQYTEFKKKQKGSAQKMRDQTRLQQDSERVALNVLCQTRGNVEACQHYLTSRLGAHCPTDVKQSLEQVQQTSAGMTTQDRTDLFDGTFPESNSKTTRRATAFLREHKLANWVQGMNLDRHIAPLTTVVLKSALNLGCMPGESTTAKHKSRKQWLRRWRKRWGAAMGRIAPREHVPADVMHAKAF